MYISVPQYGENGFAFVWDEDFAINCSIENNCVRIEANKQGLISLARHLLELAQDDVPQFTHFHLDEFNSLEDDSSELLFVRNDTI